MASPTDAAQRKALLEHLDRAVKAGEPVVNPELLKKIKAICKQSEAYVDAAHHFLNAALSKEHSQIRLSALQVCHELFLRSQHFRDLLIADFKDFVEHVVEVKVQTALPPPPEAAKALNIFALKAIEEWHKRFGEGNARLKVAYNFLRRVKGKDFANLEATAAERSIRENAERERLAKVKRERLARAVEELRATAGEVEAACKAFDEACKLLVPEPEEFWIAGHPERREKDEEEEWEVKDNEEGEEERKTGKKRKKEDEEEEGRVEKRMRQASSEAEAEESGTGFEGDGVGLSGGEREHGWLGSFALDITLEGPPEAVIEDEDNAVLLEALKDQEAVLSRGYLPLIRGWMRTFSAAEGEDDRLKRCMDLKTMVQERMKQFAEMQIRGEEKEEESEESDSELEEVAEKEGYEEELQPGPSRLITEEMKKKEEKRKEKEKKEEEKEKKEEATGSWDPTEGPSEGPSSTETSERKQRAKAAPELRFGLDLLAWDREVEPMVLVRDDAFHRFWHSSEAESVVLSKETMEALQRRRAVPFGGEFRPVERECRAPLHTGGLCRRMDRLKCPFHGRIIARDATGQPVVEAERERLRAEAELREAVERRQAVLQERRARRATKLVDLRKVSDTPANRIAKRVMNRSALKRVANVMNTLEHRKQLEKFGQQFNYILKSSRKM